MELKMLMRHAPALFVLAMWPFWAFAWMSGPEGPLYGPAEAVKSPPWRWDASQTPPNEHARLLEEAMGRAGIPLSGTFRATVYTDKDSLVGAASPGQRSVFPKPASAPTANLRTTRSYDIAGFASLVDHTYSMADWAAGSEICPPGTTPPNAQAQDAECHDFDFHLGMLNSTHFPPQAQQIYLRYHAIALQRASDCPRLGAVGPNQQARDVAEECEREALLIESTGQHFLQDAWAIGHMWERWGYSSFGLFPGWPRAISYERAVLTGLVSGLIHGAEAILHIPDAMSTGNDTRVQWVNSAAPNLKGEGIGDLHADSMLSNVSYAAQKQQMLDCSASGLRDVYARTAQLSGDMKPFAGAHVDPTSSACWAQRATNEAMMTGFGLKCPQSLLTGPSDSDITRFCRVAELAANAPEFWARAVPFAKKLISGSPTFSAEARNEFAQSMVLLSVSIVMAGNRQPLGIDLASGGLPFAFMNVEKNSLAAQASIPAKYADPPLPWSPNANTDSPTAPWDPASYLARVFNRSHAKEMCVSPETAPNALHDKVQAASEADLPIACEICIEFTSRHVAAEGHSVCTIAGANTEPLLAESGQSARSVARVSCGCGHWDVAEDFSSKNQSDIWRYGSVPLQPSNTLPEVAELRPFTFQGRYSGIDALWDPIFNFAGTPNVARNSTEQTVDKVSGLPFLNGRTQTGITVPPKGVTLHSGARPRADGLQPSLGVTRWTAPYDGNFRIQAIFTPADITWSGMDFYVLRSGWDTSNKIVVLYQHRMTSISSQLSASFDSGTVALKQGDRIDFGVGPGPNLDRGSDTVVLQATIDLLR